MSVTCLECWNNRAEVYHCPYGGRVTPIQQIGNETFISAVVTNRLRQALPKIDFSAVSESSWDHYATSNQWDGDHQNRHQEGHHRVSLGESNGLKAYLARDCASISFELWSQPMIEELKVNRPILKLRLRDRSLDGTDLATPPGYAWVTGQPLEQKPATTRRLGLVDWSYTGPDDVQPSGMRSVEVTRYSGHPDYVLPRYLKGLNLEADVDLKSLSRFIINPFDALGNSGPDKIDLWLTSFKQVVDLTLKHSDFPYPGQYSTRTFHGVAANFVDNIIPSLQDSGYTHISSIPTWPHIYWQNTRERGYTPSSADEQAAELFFTAANKITYKGIRLGTLPLSTRLKAISWAAQAGFAAQIIESVGLKAEDIFHQHDLAGYVIRDTFGKLIMWPLRLDHNLWLNKKI